MRAPVGTRYRMVTAGGNVDAVADSNRNGHVHAARADDHQPDRVLRQLTSPRSPARRLAPPSSSPANVFDSRPVDAGIRRGSGGRRQQLLLLDLSGWRAVLPQICETANLASSTCGARAAITSTARPKLLLRQAVEQRAPGVRPGADGGGTSPDGHENYALDIAP